MPSLSALLAFGQRPRRGESPVEHRGTFVRPAQGHEMLHRGLTEGLQELKLRSKKADVRPENVNQKLDIAGPENLDFRPERLDLRPERLYLRPERLDLRPERLVFET